MVSPRQWRQLVKPALAETFRLGQAHGVWVAYHCCGALRGILPDLVEMGMDVLNPVELSPELIDSVVARVRAEGIDYHDDSPSLDEADADMREVVAEVEAAAVAPPQATPPVASMTASATIPAVRRMCGL